MKLSNITKIYHNKDSVVKALDNISLVIDHSGITIINGSNGSGKSTLLNIISGLDTDFSGTYSHDESIYLVSQDYDLFMNLTVLENLKLCRYNHKQINTYLEMFDISRCVNQKCKLLSNGQKRRVQIVKALLNKCDVILFDETLIGLDDENLYSLLDCLKKLSTKKCIIMVTHNPAISKQYGDRIITLDNGHIIQDIIRQQCKTISISNHKIHQSTKKHLLLNGYYIKETMGHMLPITLLISIASIAIVFLFSFFLQMNASQSTKLSFETNKNVVSSIPINKKLDSSLAANNYIYPEVYGDYEAFNNDLVEQSIDIYDSIVALEAFYSAKYSQLEYIDKELYGNDTQSKFTEERAVLFPKFDVVKNNPITNSSELSSARNIITTAPYYLVQDSSNYYNQGLFTIDGTNSISDSMVVQNQVHLYSLVNNYDSIFELYCGSFPVASNELVIDYSFATKLKDDLYPELDSLDALLGKTLDIHVQTESGKYSSFNYCKNEEECTLDGQSYIYPIDHQFTYTITGITNYNNQKVNNAYMIDLPKDSLMMKSLVNEGVPSDQYYWHYVNYMIDPNCDVESFIFDISRFYNLELNEFVTMDQLLMVQENDVSYQNPLLLVGIISILLIILLVVIFFIIYQDRTYYKHLKQILVTLGYKYKYLLIDAFLLFILVTCIASIFIVLVSPYINNYAQMFRLSQLIMINPWLIMTTSLVLVIIVILYYQYILRK